MTSTQEQKIDRKTHFARTDDMYPICSRTLIGFCGAIVLEAVTLHVWDELPTGTSLDLSAINAINTCKECVQKLRDKSGTIYAVKSARALKTKEGEL